MVSDAKITFVLNINGTNLQCVFVKKRSDCLSSCEAVKIQDLVN